MKKILKIIISINLLLIASLFFVQISYANSLEKACEENPGKCLIGPEVTNGTSASNLPKSEIDETTDPNSPPKITMKAAETIMSTVFKIAGILGVISLIVSGTMMVISQTGNDEMLETAKKILSYTAIGFIIIAGAYAMILGISNIRLS